METIASLSRLRQIMGEPGPLTRYKLHPRLTPQARAFIARAPLFILASANAKGEPTLSPKGDGCGFVQVEDDATLLIPERPGNRLLFSLENILANPNIGMIFLSPGTDETLRVAGKATLLHDPELNTRFSARGKPALLLMRVQIQSCYFHCAKAFLRSGLWNAAQWPAPMKVSFAEEIHLRQAMSDEAQRELDAQIANRYRTDL